MAHIIYLRENYFVDMRRTAKGGAVVSLSTSNSPLGHSKFPARSVRAWLASQLGYSAREELKYLLELLNQLPLAAAARAGNQPTYNIFRVVLRIDDNELSSLAWEPFLDNMWRSTWGRNPKPVFVRATPVRFPIAVRPLTLPLRILEAGEEQDSDLAEIVLPLFGAHNANSVARAIKFDNPSRVEKLIDYRLTNPLIPVDILHVWRPQFPDDIEDVTLASQPERPGTLGWVMRLTHELRCRLLVLMCDNDANQTKARRLGASVTARGGPAVLVLSPSSGPNKLQGFYERLVHNFPLDEAARSAAIGTIQTLSLFVGGGREEALRFTRLGEELKNLAEDLLQPLANLEIFEAKVEALRKLVGSPIRITRWQPFDILQRKALQRFVENWPSFKFEEHEREGLLPLSDIVLQLSENLFGQQQQQQQQVPERFVNSSLWAEHDDAQPVRLEQSSARLSLENIYHLEVSIGPKDVRVQTLDAAPLNEEIFEWEPQISGTWLEIGITGLDCETWGDPVRDVWLPQSGASEPIYFAIQPTVAPVARLRFCVYYKQNVIQSFRLALITTKLSGGREQTLPRRRKLLAKALGVADTSVPDVGFLPRMEYSLGRSTEQWTSRPARAEDDLHAPAAYRTRQQSPLFPL